MKMSRSQRRQLLTADLVRGAVDACRGAYEEAKMDIPKDIENMLVVIDSSASEAAKYAYGRTDGHGRFVLDVKETIAYQRPLMMLKRIIQTRYGDHIDARDFLSAVILVVSDLVDQLPANNQRRLILWNDALLGLIKLYEDYDPDLSEREHMDSGGATGEAFIEVLTA